MLTEGVHVIPLRAYIADPAPEPSLNAWAVHTLISQSPRHVCYGHPRLNANYEADESSRLDVGTIAHALLLENDSSRVVVIEADDWRKKEAKEQRDEARALGKLPILSKDYFGIQEMVVTAKAQIATSEFAEDWREAIPEQTLLWQHGGVWCRSRPDKATPDWRILFDYKTVAGSAHPQAFMRTIIQQGYDIQAELGMMGVEALGLNEGARVAFVFVVQEIEPPYALSFVSLSPQWQQLAYQKIKRAMMTWKGCLRENHWPTYTTQVAYLDPPAYASIGWDEYLHPINAEDVV
ncbi:MAG: PD-(D/E)XK nuclease-like domain-containing protein [Nitrospira sp.]|nr:PD-(D/E)XK nuclease-like domain-containing protein [Nitrospira sp.]